MVGSVVDGETGLTWSFDDGVLKELRIRKEGAAHIWSQKRRDGQKRDVCEEGGREERDEGEPRTVALVMHHVAKRAGSKGRRDAIQTRLAR